MAAEDLLERARVLADLGRYDDADPLLAQALAESPDNEDGLALHVRGLVGRKRFGEAEAAARQLVRTHPDSLRALLFMARLPGLLGRPRDGLAFARQAVALYPGNVLSLVALADVLSQVTEGSAEALALVTQAIAIDPEHAPACKLAGKISLDTGQYADAERWLLQALRVNPADPSTMLLLGLAQAGLGRAGESRDQVLAALRLKPQPGNIDQVISHVESRGIPGHLAEVYRMALTARGLPDLSQPGAAGTNPELIAAQGTLAWRMYSRDAGRAGHRRAGELADAVLSVDPGNADARYVRSRVLANAGQYQQARPIAEQLLADGYPRAPMALVPILQGLGDYEGALALIRKALADNPDDPRYLRAQAHSLRRLKRHSDALASGLRAAELSPSAPEVQLELGLAAKEAGDLALAERALRAAAAQAPDEGYPAGELALLLAQTGRWPEAQTLMGKLTTDLPDADRLARPCLGLLSQCSGRVAALTGESGSAAPGPEILREMAHWMDLMLTMARLAAIGDPAVTAGALRKLPAMVAALRTVPAPPDSEFARAVAGFDELTHAWRLT